MPIVPQSKVQPTVCRMLVAYSNDWEGPRPAVCVNTFACNENRANFNIMFDGGNDRRLLEQVRKSPDGNTFMSLPVYDSLTLEQRAAALASSAVIVEWPNVNARQSAA